MGRFTRTLLAVEQIRDEKSYYVYVTKDKMYTTSVHVVTYTNMRTVLHCTVQYCTVLCCTVLYMVFIGTHV